VAFKCLDPDGWRVEVYWEDHSKAVAPIEQA
jgi:hypothetical protein